ncbi:MAG: rRNA (guanine745-N1)-methyltransferase [Microbacteriaceae bacterium]|nr:rRNA (guanine745-N1)-methyltransferase [Microbacteriaceae bacterium]
MTSESLAGWLRCPACSRTLQALSTLVLGCDNGHRFDVNKRGYVSLLASTSKVIGDSAAMLDARTHVLASGVYSPIVDALIELARPSNARPRVLDAGCGTGYYLHRLLTAVGGQGLAMDLSPAAVARAVRSQVPAAGRADGYDAGPVDGLVADTWRPLPIRDGVADIVLNVFAPRNIAEFHRVLAADGTVLVVVPTAGHLAELRVSDSPSGGGRMLDIPADKAGHLAETVAPYFALDRQQDVTFTMRLDDATADQLVAMGPSAHHAPARHAPAHNESAGQVSPPQASALQASGAARADAATFRNVTASVDILRFRKREV